MTRAPIGAPLPPSFYERSAEEVARDLLGAVLVSEVEGEIAAGRIVETEAYIGPEDPASHAAERIGRTARNAAMFGPAGIAYIYRIYGLHWCLNAVTGSEGHPAAVLIRAIEPLAGIEVMRRRRGSGIGDLDLARGPGRLAQALGITGALNQHPLDRPPLLIAEGAPVPSAEIAVGPRIGITRARDWPLRFHLRDNSWVSGRR